MGSEKSRSESRQRALCILGVHRSGTSAVIRSFNLLGAFVGDETDLMPGIAENPLGFWERNDIYSFHERLLAAARRSWDTGLTFPDGWQRSPEMTPYREELKSIVSAAFAGRPLWAWKDPRTCLLLDLWKDVLGELEIDLAAVFVLRHPGEVAASLGKRNGFQPGKAFGIWLGHTLAALRSAEGVRTAFIGYGTFLEDPIGEVRRCAETLGISPPGAAACAAIGDFVRKELRHHLATAHDLEALPSPVRDVYEMIRRAVEKPAACDHSFFEQLRELHRQYSVYAEFFREDLAQRLCVAGELEKSEARCREAFARAFAAEQKVAEAEQRVLRTEEHARATKRALEQVVTSRIWRITGPVRNAADLVRGWVHATRSGRRTSGQAVSSSARDGSASARR